MSEGSFGDRLADIARAVEERCYTVCETCGAPALLRQEDSWYHTACDRHGRGRWSRRWDPTGGRCHSDRRGTRCTSTTRTS